mgnify:FL=1
MIKWKYSASVVICFVAIITCGCTYKTMPIVGMPNPWSECHENYSCAEKIAGFNMPLNLSNYSVRAMKGMVEVTYPLDENRMVTVRKTIDESKEIDNSGDYNKYEESVLTLPNGVEINVRKKDGKIIVMYFAAESGCYSARCEQGISKKEVEDIYNVLAEVEANKCP